MNTQDILIDDFRDPRFQQAFRLYFSELGISVKDWEGLFHEMNNDPNGKNYAYLRMADDHSIIGFIQFMQMTAKSWFFELETGFIREFWIAEPYRKNGHGRNLLLLAEQHFLNHNIFVTILTTDTASGFYERNGYVHADTITAMNNDAVYVKILPKNQR